MQTVSAIIRGKVQGVFFRQSTVEQATILGITGRVMNLPDGAVKIIATGEPEQIDALLRWCHKGPRLATVESVHAEYTDLRRFSEFEIGEPDD